MRLTLRGERQLEAGADSLLRRAWLLLRSGDRAGRLAAILICFFALQIAIVLPGVAGNRVALVIGNDRYDHLPNLRKAVNDARAVAKALRKIGFDVIAGENLSRRAMNARLRALDAKAQPGDELFFFYSGHGVAVSGENFLIPTDMPKPRPGQQSMVVDEAHAVGALINRFQNRGVKTSFVVLDACRDNPFAQSGVRSIGRSKGLTRVDAPTGVFVLFAAGTGQTALDRLSNADDDPNSVFTRKLLPLMDTPGLSHVRLAKRIQVAVRDLARTVGHEQFPAYYDQIIGEMYLLSGPPPTGEITEMARLRAEVERLRREKPRRHPDNADRKDEIIAIIPAPHPATPTPTPALPAVPKTNLKEMTKGLQRGLDRAGCSPGAIDGVWGLRSRRAMVRFNSNSGMKLNSAAPTAKALAAIEHTSGRICPGDQKKVVSRPPSTIKRNVRVRKKRPVALEHSRKVWPSGSIQTGMTVTKNIRGFGVLSCRGGSMSRGQPRECSWR